MRRRLTLLAAVLGIVLMGLGVVAAQEGFSLTGRLGATDQEAQEGYFAIDSQTMIVVKPGSEMHVFLRGKVGQRIRLTVEPDSESE